MILFFIEESNNKKILKKIERNDDVIILNCNIDRINKNIMNKINKILSDNCCTKVILSKELKYNKALKNSLYSNNISIVNGKKLHKKLLEKLIESTCLKDKLNAKQSQISITANYIDNTVIKLIENLSKQFKLVNIVSNNTCSYNKIKEKLYNEYGIIITISNNKKKALLKSNLIINYDFPEELLNKFSIKNNSIIINTEEPIRIRKKIFNGKILNDYNILLKKNSSIDFELNREKYRKYDIKDLAEVYIMQYPEEICNIIV